MGSFASVNGSIVPAEEARVSVLDNGFTFGDAVYETLRTYGGRPFELHRHLARLRASAARLGFAIPPDDAELGAQPRRPARARAGNPESYIRFIVSRGVGDISYHFDRVQGPTIVMVVKPFEPFPEAPTATGSPWPWSTSAATTRGPRPRDQVVQPAQQHPGHPRGPGPGRREALLLNDAGELAEGASTNVFVVKDGVAHDAPPGAGILAGITRESCSSWRGRPACPSARRPCRPRPCARPTRSSSPARPAKPCRPCPLDGRPVGGGRPGP